MSRRRQDTFVGLARTVYIYTVYDRIFGDFPARNTVYTPYIYGSGKPYTFGGRIRVYMVSVAVGSCSARNIETQIGVMAQSLDLEVKLRYKI